MILMVKPKRPCVYWRECKYYNRNKCDYDEDVEYCIHYQNIKKGTKLIKDEYK